MQKSTARRVGAAFAATVLVGTLAACSSAATGGAVEPGTTLDPDAEVTIHVGNMPASTEEAERKNFDDLVEQFGDSHPNITVIGEEVKYEAQTFAAMVAGGTMPTVMSVPYTELQRLAGGGQVKEITGLVEQDEFLAQMNPEVAKQAERDGKTYGVVSNAYTLALLYNRDLYEQAGLDPDKPPTTWDEVRENAKAISDATNQTGFIVGTTNNVGGWMTTALSYAFGGMVQNEEGTEATVENDGTIAALEFLNDVRWEDDSAGANFLMNQDDIGNAFAAGQLGQTILDGGAFSGLVGVRGMDAEDVGIAPIPQAPGGLGTLGGGSVQVVSPTATDQEAAAALEWVKFRFLNRFLDEDAAMSVAETRKEAGLPVGHPEVPLLSDEAYEEYLGWIDALIDTPREQFTAYFESIATLPIVLEPRTAAQDTYATLDAVLQKVLTTEGVDIPAELAQAQLVVQDIVDSAQQ